MNDQNLVAVDLGGTNTRVAIVSGSEIVCQEAILTDVSHGPQRAAELWAETIKKWIPQYKPLAIGIGSPGPLDSSVGCILETPNLKSWAGFSFTQFLKDTLGLPCFLENDANCAALGEWSVNKVPDQVVLTLGTGVGSGVICDGKLLRGFKGMAVEAGHMSIDRNGPKCACGKRGCLEAFVGGASLIQLYESLSPSKEKVSPEEIFERAQKNEKLAKDLVHAWTQNLAIGIGNLVNIFNPHAVILTGGLSASFPKVEKDFNNFLITQAFHHVLQWNEVRVSQLQGKAGLIGAAVWAKNNYV